MLVENYIKNLLFEFDCVVIPDLGGFITRQHPANIHPITNRFLAPSKGIAFNEQLKVNDGLLISAIAREENIERESAVKLVNDYVHFITEKLKSTKQYFLKDIGKLFYNPENNLEFEPYDKINYLEDSFGLTELFFKPIERNFKEMSKIPPRAVRPIEKRKLPAKNQQKKVKPAQLDEFGDEVKSNQSFRAIYFLPLLLLIASAIGLLYLNKTGKSLATMVPGNDVVKEQTVTATTRPIDTATTSSTDLSIADVPAEAEDKAENSFTEPKPESKRTSSSTSLKKGKFYIVVGSFGIKANANKLKRRIASEGGAPVVIEPNGDSKFYKVAVAGHGHLDSAVQQMEELRATYGNSIWVLTY
jgi:cell division protein FtsN